MMDSFERAASRELIDKNRLAIRVHAGVYVAVQLLLVITWALTSGPDGFPWFVFPMLGWGIGLVAHFAVYSVVRRQTPASPPRSQPPTETAG